MDTWTRATQNATKRTAEKHGEVWTSSDLELLAEFETEALAELARTTGRTYFAVSTMKSMVRAGKVDPAKRKVRVAASDRPYRGWVEGMGDE